MTSFIGIDLGTTFSAVATIDDTGRPVIIRNKTGSNVTPSCVAEISENVFEVGEFARRQWGTAPETAAARFKRSMGTSELFKINQAHFTPTQLSALVLKKILSEATEAVGDIAEAIVTIPANFAHEARAATIEAAKSAGLNVSYIVNEPTAAALYYVYSCDHVIAGNYAVYDLGGGTFDISIIRVNGHEVEVLSTNGISKLGGDDFDKALTEIVCNKYVAAVGEDLEPGDFTVNDSEEEKKALSTRDRVTLRVARQMIDISREEFNESISAYIAQTEMLCESTVEDAQLRIADIDGVLLVGGSTRIPAVKESVKRIFNKEPVDSINVDEVVALGAALYAAYKGDDKILSPVQKNSIKRLQVTESTSKCFGTLSLQYDSDKNSYEQKNSVMIAKGEQIPCSVTDSFYTTHEGQTSVSCEVTESTSAETDPNFVKVIWKGLLELPPDRPTEQEIQVTYSYDENQIMHCSFVDVESGFSKEIDLKLTDSNQTESSDIERFLVE